MGKAQVAANSKMEKSCKKTTSPNNFNCKREPEGSPRRSKRLAGEKPELTIDLTSKRTLEYTIKKTRAANANLQQTEATKDTQSEATQSFASPHSSSDSCLESTTNETGQEVMLFGVVIGFSSNKKLPHGVSEVMQTERALMVSSANEKQHIENTTSNQRPFVGMYDESTKTDVAVSSELMVAPAPKRSSN